MIFYQSQTSKYFSLHFISHFFKLQQALNFTCELIIIYAQQQLFLMIEKRPFLKVGLIIFKILIVYLETFSQIVISKKLELAHLNFA